MPELCTCCGNELQRGGVYYADRARVCKRCHQVSMAAEPLSLADRAELDGQAVAVAVSVALGLVAVLALASL